jgi:hypothetical protein
MFKSLIRSDLRPIASPGQGSQGRLRLARPLPLHWPERSFPAAFHQHAENSKADRIRRKLDKFKQFQLRRKSSSARSQTAGFPNS